MSYSIPETRRRLPLLYLAIPLAGLIYVVYPRIELLCAAWPAILTPAWIGLAHLLCGFSYLITGRSVKSGLVLIRSSIWVYGRQGSIVHLQAALLTALAEEMVFRYLLLGWLSERLTTAVGALLVTSVAFAAAHALPGRARLSLRRLLDLFVFALVLGALFIWARSVVPAIVLHAFRNYILRCLLISREEYEALRRAQQAKDGAP